MYQDVNEAKLWWSKLSRDDKIKFYHKIYTIKLVDGEISLISNLQKIRLYKEFSK